MIEGKDLMVFWKLNGEFKAIALATNCRFTMTRDSIESTSKSSGDARDFIPTTMSWSVTSDNIVTEENRNLLYELFLTGGYVTIAFALDFGCDKPTNGWQPNGSKIEGTAFIQSLDENAPDGGLATHSIVFQGSGKPKINFKVSGGFSDGFSDGFEIEQTYEE